MKSMAVSKSVEEVASTRSAQSQRPRFRWTQAVSLFVLLLIVAGTAAIRVRLLSMPLERDEGEFALAGQLIRQGHPPYDRLYNMKWPGTYYGYALIESIFGETTKGIRLGILCLNAVSIVLVYLIGRRLLDVYAATAAALVYAMLSISPGMLGLAGHATHFVVAAVLAAILSLQQAFSTRRLSLFLLTGIFAGLAPVMKQPGIVFTAFIASNWLFLEVRAGESRRVVIRRGIALLTGIGLAIGLMLGSVVATHTFRTFWLWTVSYARHYGPRSTASQAVQQFFLGLSLSVGPGLLFWILAGAGACLLPMHPRTRARAPFLLGFLAISLLAVCPSLIFRTQYFLMLLPAVGLLCGAAVFVVRRRMWTESPRAALLWVCGLILVPLSVDLLLNSPTYFRTSPDEVCRAMYGLDCPFVESAEVADYLRQHTAPQDTIAVLGSEPQIYFYARRPPATGHIYTYAMMENQPYAHQFQEQMIREIEAARPRYVVLVLMKMSWLETPKSDPTLMQWFERYQAKNLKLVGIVERDRPTHSRFRWNETELRQSKNARPVILVYKRIAPS
jgi:4-amino-4-deoxy-L-arabinose transferase-like glycosyltransferase